MISDNPTPTEPNPCLKCGSKVSAQTFGPSETIQTPITLWMCSNSNMLGGLCDAAYCYTEEVWNASNNDLAMNVRTLSQAEPLRTEGGALLTTASATHDLAIGSLVRYHALLKQKLTSVGLWNEKFEKMEEEAAFALQHLSKDGLRESAMLGVESSHLTMEYDDSDNSCAIRFDNGKVMTVFPDETIVLGQVSEGTRPFKKVSFDEIYDTSSSLQFRKNLWMRECFDDEITDSFDERNRRFLEEALELVQSLDMSRLEAHYLVDYVYSRDRGEPYQEVGGALLTLAALCSARKINMIQAGEHELARVWTKIDHIRAKQKKKPLLKDDVENLIRQFLDNDRVLTTGIAALAGRVVDEKRPYNQNFDFLSGVIVAAAAKEHVRILLAAEEDRGLLMPTDD